MGGGGQEPVSMATLARFWRQRPWNAHPMCSKASRGRTEEGGGPGGPAGLPPLPPTPSSPTAADSPTAQLFRGKGIQYLQQEETPRAVSRSWGGGGCILTHFLCGGDLHILGGINYKLQTTEEPRRNRTCGPDEAPTFPLTSCRRSSGPDRLTANR